MWNLLKRKENGFVENFLLTFLGWIEWIKWIQCTSSCFLSQLTQKNTIRHTSSFSPVNNCSLYSYSLFKYKNIQFAANNLKKVPKTHPIILIPPPLGNFKVLLYYFHLNSHSPARLSTWYNSLTKIFSPQSIFSHFQYFSFVY
jgi:hypothetical protein